MAVYDHQEEEQLAELKAWWQQNGNKILNIAIAIAVVLALVAGWKWWANKQAVEASALYSKMQMAGNDSKQTLDIAVELADKYSGTVYADLGSLLAARIQADAGDLKNAKLQLTRVADKASDPAVSDVANLRLAGILFDEKAYDEALKRLAAPKEKAYAARFEELKGDVLMAQGKTDDARGAYTKAVAAMALDKPDEKEKSDPAARSTKLYREMLQIKLDSLGGKA